MAEQAVGSRVSVAATRAGETVRPVRERLREAAKFWIAGAALFAIALPLLLITGNVRIISSSSWLYEWDFNRYNIERRTLLDREQLRRASSGIIDYFNNDEEFLDIQVDFGQGDVPLFKEREILHMRDVKDLMFLVNDVERGAFGFVVAFMLLGFAVKGWSFLSLLRQTMIWSGIGTFIVVVGLGIASAVAFEQVFLQFHLISFANDLWKLDPATHWLIRMFPENFFLDATLAIAVATIVQFAVLFGLVWWFAKVAGRRVTGSS